ncbi:GNAT family N-acetyltransferase [Streptosporangium sp. NPDC005286]|uniref:GNAT family N-acetyltransferase n=1 Tax=Streptosporangium sp. NPDC005286 TaxID=3154463 RepID=UPI0033A9DF35
MTDVDFRCLTGRAAAEVLSAEYVDLYVAAYAEWPYLSGPLYSPERYAERTSRQVMQDSFVLVSARSRGRLVGFSFGLRFGAGLWWGGEAAPAPPEVVEPPKFAVIELDVAGTHRGRGIGRRLLETLLAQQSAPYATLLADPDAPAHAMYQRWGWQVVGPVRAAPDARTYDALVLDLNR